MVSSFESKIHASPSAYLLHPPRITTSLSFKTQKTESYLGSKELIGSISCHWDKALASGSEMLESFSIELNF